MLVFFYGLGFLALLEAIGSLLTGVQFHRFVLQSLRRKETPYGPKVSVILPFRGMDQGLAENLQALIDQDYPDFEILFVTDQVTDPAYEHVRVAMQRARRPVRILVAGPASDCGQKVHNLLYAVRQARPDTEVLVFTDSDARPHRTWLRHLVAPLRRESVGATTGYRWYLPATGGFWSLVQSAWNAAVVTLLGGHGRNFAWGGAMALRVKTFHEAQVAKYWSRALSDDYALTNAMRKAGLTVAFVPQCLTVTYHDTNLPDLLEWSSRQILITRIYSPGLWKLSFLSQINYNAVLAMGFSLAATRGSDGVGALGPLGLCLTILGLGIWKGSLRLHSVRKLWPQHAAELRRYAWGYRLLAPFVSWLTLYAMIRSLTTNRVRWRGITYEMRSPFDTRIVRDETP